MKVPVLRCAACGAIDPGPRTVCPCCLSDRLEASEVSGEGRLVSWTMIRRAPSRFRAEQPYAVCLVELEGGLRVTGRLRGAAEELPDAMLRAVERGEGYTVFEA